MIRSPSTIHRSPSIENKAVSIRRRCRRQIYVVAIFSHQGSIFPFWWKQGAIDSFRSSPGDTNTTDPLSCWLQACNHLPDDDTHHFHCCWSFHSNCYFIFIFLAFQAMNLTMTRSIYTNSDMLITMMWVVVSSYDTEILQVGCHGWQ